MKSDPPAQTGILASLRLLGETVLTDVRDRVTLLALELEEERHRLIRTLVWISAAMFAGVLALGCASLLLVCHFWETARLPVLAGLTAFYGLVLLVLVVLVRRLVLRQPKPFAATLEEIEEDRRCFRREP